MSSSVFDDDNVNDNVDDDVDDDADDEAIIILLNSCPSYLSR